MGTRPVFSNTAVLVVILIGGFVSNAVWCVILNYRNRSYKDYVTGPIGRQLMQLFPVGAWRHDLVRPVFLLRHGNHSTGQGV